MIPRTLPALLIALLAAGSALAQTADKRAFVVPHVLEASGRASSVASPAPAEVNAPRDCASGQASGRSVAGYDLNTNKGARMALPACDGASKDAAKSACASGTCSPSPVEAAAVQGRSKELTGHVTLVK